MADPRTLALIQALNQGQGPRAPQQSGGQDMALAQALSVPNVRDMQSKMRMEAQQNEALKQQRLMQEAQFMSSLPPSAPPDQSQAVAQYIQGMRAQQPQAPQAPAAAPWANFPSSSELLKMIGLQQTKPDVQLDDRLGRISGDMAINNQRHMQRLDDFSRGRARSGM